jgi:hypothetical protein
MIRRSHTGILIYLNKAPIQWFSKQQHTVEGATFGSEFNALRIAVDLIVALRFKLRSFGVPVKGPANVFCDNQAVVNVCSRPHGQLGKKHNQVCYHRVREAVAAGIIQLAYVNTASKWFDEVFEWIATRSYFWTNYGRSLL